MKTNVLPVVLGLLLASVVRADLVYLPLYHYVYTPIPASGSYLDLEPTQINNKNQVVGTAYIPGFGGPEAFLSSAGHTQLYPFPGGYSDDFGFGINDAGLIVGAGTTAAGQHAFYATPGNAPIDIDSSPLLSSTAKSVTNNGYFVGQARNQPALGSTTGHWILPVGSTLGNTFYMTGINDDLTVIGYSSAGGAIWDISTGTVTQLSTVLGTTNNKATAINQNGAVAGTIGTTGFIYANGTVTYFGTNIASVNGINLANKVVGNLTNGHGFIYVPSTNTVTDLNSLLPASIAAEWTVKYGMGINDHDSICGLAVRPAKAADNAKGWDGTVYQGFTLILSPLFVVGPKLPSVLTPE